MNAAILINKLAITAAKYEETADDLARAILKRTMDELEEDILVLANEGRATAGNVSDIINEGRAYFKAASARAGINGDYENQDVFNSAATIYKILSAAI